MKTKYFFLAAIGAMTLASCSNDELVGDNSPTLGQEGDGSIQFSYNLPNATRAGEFSGATAADMLGGMFVVEGTKGPEEDDSPSKTVVFDNYLVGYEYNSAGKTESNTNNWEYVGKEAGITGRMTGTSSGAGSTWATLHIGTDDAKVQSIKYWDYSAAQYDFIAWSTGQREAVTTGAVAGSKVNVTRIATGASLASSAFILTAANATDLLQCYYTDINTVTKSNYGQPVTLTFRNMAAKVRVALYETVPGYSVKEVKFYTKEADDPTEPDDLGNGTVNDATLFTTGAIKLPQSGAVTVSYPRIGNTVKSLVPRPVDYNKASVSVSPGSSVSSTQAFGALTEQYRDEEGNEPDGKYLGTSLPSATFAGDAEDKFYTAVIPNTNGQPLTLRVDYTLVSTDGSDEEIKVYGAKAVVPATYTNWLSNYAYTYVFKISDNSNGYTSQLSTDPAGLFPITFDALVTSFVDVNAEQTTVTTVATPSITTYQQGHTKATNEYNKNQKAGKDVTNVKPLYVQVMDNGGAAPALKTDLQGTGGEAGKKSLLYLIQKGGADYGASEAEVMDALQNHAAAYAYGADNPVGRNGIELTKSSEINNAATQIVNGVNDQPIGVTAGEVAEIDIKDLDAGTYAYVYCTKVPTKDEKVYHLVSPATAEAAVGNYYEIALLGDGTDPVKAAGTKALADKVYFIKNYKSDGTTFDSYTFKQTKVDDDVAGYVEASIVSKGSTYSASKFYFDVYNQNDGEYAVKVIKVVDE